VQHHLDDVPGRQPARHPGQQPLSVFIQQHSGQPPARIRHPVRGSQRRQPQRCPHASYLDRQRRLALAQRRPAQHHRRGDLPVPRDADVDQHLGAQRRPDRASRRPGAARRQERHRSQRRLDLAGLPGQRSQQHLRAGHGELSHHVTRRGVRRQPERDIRSRAARQHDRQHQPQPSPLIRIQPLADQPRLPLHATAMRRLGATFRAELVAGGGDHQDPVRIPDLRHHPQRPVPPLF
jgi:hypothetical protein